MEIVYVSQGHLRWEVEGRVEDIFPQSVFFTFPWEEHGSRDEYEPGHHCYWVVLGLHGAGGISPKKYALHPALGFSKSETARIRRVLTGASHRSFRSSREVAWIVPELVNECRRADSFAQPAVQSLTRLLLVELIRCIESEKPSGKVLSGVETRVRACIQAIGERSGETWTLEGMSRLSGLSRTRFAEMLKKITGDTPLVYLRRMRVRRAQELLRGTNRSITEIALETGFASSQHFARIFKHFCQQPASRYRELHRQ